MTRALRLRRHRPRRARQRHGLRAGRRGHRVLGLERFELGHSPRRQPRHQPDPAAQLPHAGLRPAHAGGVRRLGAARAATRASGWSPRTGGLDLFPPDPAIPSVDYTDVDGRGRHRLRRAGRRRGDGAVAAAAAAGRDARAVPGRRRDRARRPRRRRAPGAGPPARRRAARPHPRARASRTSAAAGCESPRRTARSTAGGVVVTADAWVNDVLGHLGVHVPVEVDARAGHLLRARPAPRTSPTCRCGSGWTTRRSTASRRTATADRQGRPGLRRPDRRPRRPHQRARPGDARRCSPSTCATLLPGRRRAAAVGALPVHAHPGPRLRDRAGARSRAGRRRAGCGARLQVRADLRPGAGRPGRPRARPRPTCRRSGSTGRR